MGTSTSLLPGGLPLNRGKVPEFDYLFLFFCFPFCFFLAYWMWIQASPKMWLLNRPKKFRESLAAQLLSQMSFFLSRSQSQVFLQVCQFDYFLFDDDDFNKSYRNDLTSGIWLFLTDEICFYHPRNYMIIETLQSTGSGHRNEIRKEYLLLEIANKETFSIRLNPSMLSSTTWIQNQD